MATQQSCPQHYATLPALLAILGQLSAHSLATGPVIVDPFISPLMLTITPALSETGTFTGQQVKHLQNRPCKSVKSSPGMRSVHDPTHITNHYNMQQTAGKLVHEPQLTMGGTGCVPEHTRVDCFIATVHKLMHAHTFKVDKHSIFSSVCLSLANDNNGMHCGSERWYRRVRVNLHSGDSGRTQY